MTLPCFAVTQCGCTDEEYQCSWELRFRHYYLWLFLQVAFSHTPPLRVLEVHINVIKGITIHNIESNIHISYSENHESTLFFCYFYMSSLPTSPIPLLRVVLFRSVLLLMLQNYKKIVLMSHRLTAFCSQCQWTHIFISLTTSIAMGT